MRKIGWITGFGLLMVLLISLYFNYAFSQISHKMQQNVLKHQEVYLREHLQKESLFYLNKGNYTLLQEFLQDQVESNPLLGYVIISDGARRILASDNNNLFPELANYLEDPSLWIPGTQLVNLDGSLMLHSTSIIPGMRRLHFGVWSYDPAVSVKAEIQPVLYRSLFVLSFGMILGIAITAYARISALNGEEKPKEARISNAFDLNELDQLGQVFNDMMAALDSNWQENTRLQQQLQDRDFIRSHYLKRLIAVQEDERKRISRELHDQTSQSLTSLMLGLKAIQEAETLEEVRQYTREYRTIIAQSLEEIQNLAFQLRPSALDDLGLVPALKRYVQELSRRKNIDIDFVWQDYTRDTLGAAEETIVYRVVQEALTNIIKHAKAGNVRIRLRIRQDKFVALVKDDGRGFNTDVIKDKDPNNLGIYGMKERAQLVGGNLYIKSRKNRGTLVMLVLPLKNEGV